VKDRLYALVVRFPAYKSRSPGLIPGTTRFGVVGLEQGQLSPMSTVEELFGRKSSGSDLENQDYDRRRSATLTT
jgi:hypothetical protein